MFYNLFTTPPDCPVLVTVSPPLTPRLRQNFYNLASISLLTSSLLASIVDGVEAGAGSNRAIKPLTRSTEGNQMSTRRERLENKLDRRQDWEMGRREKAAALDHPHSIRPFGLDNRSEDSRSDAGV